ncbi:MAG: hypothetical protein WAU81_09455, partial [Candidatus Aminicenantales bacterium]
GVGYALTGRKQDAEGILIRLNKIERERFMPPLKRLVIRLVPTLKLFRFLKHKYVSPLLKALVLFSIGRIDEGLDQLEKSADAHDYFLPAFLLQRSMPNFPGIEKILSDARFKALLAQLHSGQRGLA